MEDNKKFRTFKNITYREIVQAANKTFGEWDLSELDLNTSVLNSIMYSKYPAPVFEPVQHEDGKFELKNGTRVLKNKNMIIVQMYVFLDANKIHYSKVSQVDRGHYFKMLSNKYLKHTRIYNRTYDPSKLYYAMMTGIIRILKGEVVISTYGTMYTEADHGGTPLLVDLTRTSWVDGILNYNLYIEGYLKKMLTKRMYKEVKKRR